MSRVIIVSNRLPITVSLSGGTVQLRRSAGGLATGLSGPHERSGGLWMGYPGDLESLDGAQRAEVDRQLAERRIVPIPLGREEVRRYYEGYANGVLWPLFHYLLDSVPLISPDWDAYVAVNEKFAAAVARELRDDDLVWVQDYQLMLLPALLRRKKPRARIGFFLHIPFPSSEIFRTLPQRAALLEGVLGADLVGFHTSEYLRHFASSALRFLGAGADIDRVSWGGRDVTLGAFPMGVDARAFAALGEEPAVLAEARSIHGDPPIDIILGIDRLDYTKGIPRRLMAFEALLANHPELREKVRLVQLAVPSRQHVEAYEKFRRKVDGMVGRINGAFATPRWVPVNYMFRSLPPRRLAALYRAARVMLVTPLRDGMNLVAKEFVATRGDEDGVLVLSELAGAAAELAEAVIVNPYDVYGTAEALYRALTMGADERRARMRGMRRRVLEHDVASWAERFLSWLDAASAAPARPTEPSSADELGAALAVARDAAHLVLLLDYDGTLVGFQPTPEQAAPDPPLRELLAKLAARPNTVVHLVSGRPATTLERWFGDLRIGLHAEHGLTSRDPGRGEWHDAAVATPPWRGKVREILDDFAARTPGSIVEEKTVGLAWHHRAVDPTLGLWRANELRLHLTELLSNVPVEILTGNKVVEVRAHGVHKGRVVAQIMAGAPRVALLVAFGDDRTDEDLFAALPHGAIAIHVGPEPSMAGLRLADPTQARAWLERLV
jgi:trehalose 6-phosphate synthase/phosphatase